VRADERVTIAASMFDAAREIVHSSLPAAFTIRSIIRPVGDEIMSTDSSR
jgi:hypothetical protein